MDCRAWMVEWWEWRARHQGGAGELFTLNLYVPSATLAWG